MVNKTKIDPQACREVALRILTGDSGDLLQRLARFQACRFALISLAAAQRFGLDCAEQEQEVVRLLGQSVRLPDQGGRLNITDADLDWLEDREFEAAGPLEIGPDGEARPEPGLEAIRVTLHRACESSLEMMRRAVELADSASQKAAVMCLSRIARGVPSDLLPGGTKATWRIDVSIRCHREDEADAWLRERGFTPEVGTKGFKKRLSQFVAKRLARVDDPVPLGDLFDIKPERLVRPG